jgi:hypothetical protein
MTDYNVSQQGYTQGYTQQYNQCFIPPPSPQPDLYSNLHQNYASQYLPQPSPTFLDGTTYQQPIYQQSIIQQPIYQQSIIQQPIYQQSDTTYYTQSNNVDGLQPVYNQVTYTQSLHISQERTQEQIQEDLLNQFYTKYDISRTFQEDIEEIKKYDIIVIADDSSSMKEPSRYLSFETDKIVNKTRWDELKETLAVVTELAVLLDDDGIDIRFLNESTYYRNIKSHSQVMEIFNRKPAGRTPLTRVLKEVMNIRSNKPKLIIIITDGEPNNDSGYSDCDNFCRLLKNRDAKNNRVAILACTTSNNQMEWLNRIDKDAEHVDVIDDYLTERNQILSVQGSNFTYSHGDHVVKMLLGPLLQKYDDHDEKKLNSTSTQTNYTQTNYTKPNYQRSNNQSSNQNIRQKKSDCVII